MYSSYFNNSHNIPTKAASEMFEEISDIRLNDQPLPSPGKAHVFALLALIIYLSIPDIKQAVWITNIITIIYYPLFSMLVIGIPAKIK